MQGIDKDIKSGDFKNVYLLCGEEDFLISWYKQRLLKALGAEKGSMNFNEYYGKGINAAGVIDTAETMPFFGDRRVILIEDSGFFKDGCDELADYLKDCCSSTYFVFAEHAIDKKRRMYTAVKKCGYIAEAKAYTPQKLAEWVAGTLSRKYGKRVKESTVQYFIQKSGSDMYTLSSEMKKLRDYTEGRDIVEISDIDAICTVSIEDRVFELTEAVTQKDAKRALERYYELVALKESPVKILALIAREFNLLLQTKELTHSSSSQQVIASKIGAAPWLVGKYMARCRKLSAGYLRGALEKTIEMDTALKSGLIDQGMAVELLIASVAK